jgi:hypothetical protein
MRLLNEAMARRAEYMHQAWECVARAALAMHPEERLALLEMAQAWTHLAEHAAEIDTLLDEARDEGVLPPRSKMN